MKITLQNKKSLRNFSLRNILINKSVKLKDLQEIVRVSSAFIAKPASKQIFFVRLDTFGYTLKYIMETKKD